MKNKKQMHSWQNWIVFVEKSVVFCLSVIVDNLLFRVDLSIIYISDCRETIY